VTTQERPLLASPSTTGVRGDAVVDAGRVGVRVGVRDALLFATGVVLAADDDDDDDDDDGDRLDDMWSPWQENLKPRTTSNFEFEQRTAAWFEERKRGITASDSGIVCGVSPYTSARSLWLLKSGGVVRDATGSEATAFGQHYEAAVAEHYELLTGHRVERAGFYWHADSTRRFGASPDGFVVDCASGARGLLEIKAPFRRSYDFVPPEYMCQMQMQLEVCDLPWCDFVCFFVATESIRIWRVFRSRHYWRWMEQKLALFLDLLDRKLEPTSDQFPNLSHDAIDQARTGALPNSKNRALLPPKVHVVDVMSRRCVLAEIVERRRISELRKKFERVATPATRPFERREHFADSGPLDEATALSAARVEFDAHADTWSRIVDASRPVASPPLLPSLGANRQQQLPDWLASGGQSRRPPVTDAAAIVRVRAPKRRLLSKPTVAAVPLVVIVAGVAVLVAAVFIRAVFAQK
jgi:putative phage-type endonuclease